jgi:hypothetical protein
MRARLILGNWVLGFMGLMVVSPFWATMCGACWFIASCWLLIHADKKGWTKEFWKSRVGKFLNEEE